MGKILQYKYNENEIEEYDYKLGKMIKKLRSERNIAQKNLCYGVCPPEALSRIENDTKDLEFIYIKIILERLGIYSEKFMHIISDEDFELYEHEVYIKKYIKEKNYVDAEKELELYEEKISKYKNIYYQFIYKTKAIIKKNMGSMLETKKLFKKAVEETVPNFENIELDNYFLSNDEIDILLEYVQICAETDENELNIKKILLNVFSIMDKANISELGKNRLYFKVCAMCADILVTEKNFRKCHNITKRGLESLTVTSNLNFRADLIFYNTLCLLNLNPQNSYLNEFLDAYFIAEFMGQNKLLNKIEQIIKEVYKWGSIEEALLSD